MLKMELDALTTETPLHVVFHFALMLSIHLDYELEIFFFCPLWAISEVEKNSNFLRCCIFLSCAYSIGERSYLKYNLELLLICVSSEKYKGEKTRSYESTCMCICVRVYVINDTESKTRYSQDLHSLHMAK